MNTVLVDANSIAHMIDISDCLSSKEFISSYFKILRLYLNLLGFLYNKCILFFDNKQNNWRQKLYKDYQANRLAYKIKNKETADKLNLYLEDLKSFLNDRRNKNNFKIFFVEYLETEADDLIYLYCSSIKREDEHVTILTTDKDLFQLIDSNKKIDIFYLRDRTFVKDNVTRKRVLYRKILLGDKSDNIPTTCKGIGESKLKDYIRFLQIIKKNAIEINESVDLKKLCKDNNIVYYKAYFNFSREQLELNKQLIDLSHVKELDQLDGFKKTNYIKECLRCTNYENSKI